MFPYSWSSGSVDRVFDYVAFKDREIMREIKFRVWLNHLRIFAADKVALTNDGKEFIVAHAGGFDTLDVSGTVIQFFTGLKDKNGKEIYEGDVLAVFDLNGDGDYDEENNTYHPERETRIVQWNKSGGFTIEWDYGDFDVTLLGWAIEHHELLIEIIGNIYENPELLQP